MTEPKYTDEQKQAAVKALALAKELNEILRKTIERNAKEKELKEQQ
jgi:hypothetical protein